MDPVAESLSARTRLRRPLPVSAVVPTASALRARRPTITPFEADESAAARRAAAPATCAAAAEVPETDPPIVSIDSPGAPRKAASPVLEKEARESEASVAETPMTPVSPAGKAGVEKPSFPAAATRTAPRDQA